MSDQRVEQLAKVLVNYSVKVRPEDKVLIQGETLAEPLIKAIHTQVLQAGALPLTIMSPDGLNELTFKYASSAQLAHIPEPMKVALETYDASISVMTSANTQALTNIPPDKMVLANQAKKDLMQKVMQRSAAGEFRWVGTLYPTNAHAQDAEMGLLEYEDFVYKACLPDMDDPVAYWKNFSKWQQAIVNWFEGKTKIRIVAPNTDISMDITGRKFINCDGKRNMPDGEVFTGPIEDSLSGQVRFSYPSTYQGRTVEGVHLWFENGEVVRATADKGEDFLLSMLDVDDGAKRVGEFAIGTNKGITQATGNTLFDEKIDGSFHMALGAGMPETGSKNESAIHWDLICDLCNGGKIEVDNELVYRDGQFLIEF